MARHKIGDPTRLALLRTMRTLAVTAKEAASLIGISPSNAGHLLRRMTDAGLCERMPIGGPVNRFGPTYRYRLKAQVVFL
jgi:DNA-binding transcriptional ArsR family regulator